MAGNSTVAAMTAASALDGTELLYAVQSSNDRKATALQVKTYSVGAGSVSVTAAKTLTATHSITLSGTDSTVMTFPSTTATIARTDAGQTFTGASTITSWIANTVDARGTWTAGATWTLPAFTLGGTVSGGGNQINNVIIGTSTPLAGAFTTVNASGVASLASGTATPAGGSTAARLLLGTTAGFGIYYGSGAPSSLTAGQGSLYLRSDGTGAADRAYINSSAGSGTTWTAVATAG